MKFLHLGFNNFVAVDKIVAIIAYDTRPALRDYQKAFEGNRLVKADHHRAVRSLVYTNDGRIITAANYPDTLLKRLNCQTDD